MDKGGKTNYKYSPRYVLPELYIHVSLKQKVSESTLNEVQSLILHKASVGIFSGDEIEKFLLVEFEQGSLKVRLKQTVKGLGVVLAIYVSAHEFIEYAGPDIRFLYDKLCEKVYESLNEEYGQDIIDKTVRKEIRVGIIGHIAEVIERFEGGSISEEETVDEITKTLGIIQKSVYREMLIPLLVRFLEDKFGDLFDWEGLPGRIPAPLNHTPLPSSSSKIQEDLLENLPSQRKKRYR